MTPDNSITRLQAAASYAQTETQIACAQTDLMQVSTKMSLAETQQSALSQVGTLLEKNNGNLLSRNVGRSLSGLGAICGSCDHGS